MLAELVECEELSGKWRGMESRQYWMRIVKTSCFHFEWRGRCIDLEGTVHHRSSWERTMRGLTHFIFVQVCCHLKEKGRSPFWIPNSGIFVLVILLVLLLLLLLFLFFSMHLLLFYLLLFASNCNICFYCTFCRWFLSYPCTLLCRNGQIWTIWDDHYYYLMGLVFGQTVLFFC